MTIIEVGKKYKDTNPKTFPESMLGATKTVTSISSDGTSVAYDYISRDSSTGSGTMKMEHAGKHLKLLD
jgi:hypothetical protein